MNSVRIGFDRGRLYWICKVGFRVERVGTTYCTGWVDRDRLPLITVPYEILEG